MKKRPQSMPDVFAPRDPLGQALQLLRMSGAFYVETATTAPWGLDIPPMDGCLMFHVLVAGGCTLAAGGETRTLRAGDFVLLPHGDGHVLRDGTDVHAQKLFDIPHDYAGPHFAHLRFGGRGSASRMICGTVRCELPGTRRLLETLPAIVHVSQPNTPEVRWIEKMVSMMAEEASELRPGSESLLSRLADIVVITAIRAWLSSEPELRAGLYAGLHDPHVGRALTAIHQHPARPWTLTSLAKASAMSRSAFSARFTELVGESAMQYVTRWRMYAAHTALRENEMSLAAVADRVGYRSEAAFSRAFKRVIGASPGVMRHRAIVDEGA